MDHGGGHTYWYKQYGKRWQMLAIIVFVNVVVQIMFITFAPIATAAARFYEVDVTGINWLAVVWPALFAPATYASAWAYHRFGLRKTMAGAGFMMALGAGVRVLSVAVPLQEDNQDPDSVPHKNGGAYFLVLVGTVIMASIQPIVLSSTTQLASAWFSEKQRGTANTLMSLGNPLGLALGSIISPAFAHDTTGDGIDKILLLHFGLALAAAIATLFLSSKPPTAPSATAAYRRGNDNLGRDFKSLRNNFGFLTLFQLFSLAVGALQALLTLMEQILRPSLYTSKDAGSLSATIVLCGMLGAAISGPLVDRTRKYKIILALSLTLSFPFTVGLAYNSQHQDKDHFLYLCAAFMGFFGFPVLPVALDLSAEITYPIPADFTSALLWCGSQVTSLVLVLLVDGPLAEDIERGPDSLEVGVWLLVGCFAAATFLSWLWSGRLVRKEAEETVNRLAQAQRRDAGLPFVAEVIDTPGSGQDSPAPGNAAAVAAFLNASQQSGSAGAYAVATEPVDGGDAEMTQLDLQ